MTQITHLGKQLEHVVAYIDKPPYQAPTELALVPMYDTVGELLTYITEERDETRPHTWVLPVGYFLSFESPTIGEIHYQDAVQHPHIADIVEDAVNEQLKEEGELFTINVIKDQLRESVQGRRRFRLLFKISHKNYTGEESDDLLNI